MNDWEKLILYRKECEIVFSPENVEAPTIKLSGTNWSDMLTRTTTQHITGTLKVDSLQVRHLNTTHLNTNGKILNASLTDIYQQKASNVPGPDVFTKHRKFQGTIYAANLKMPATAIINGKPVEDIERKLTQLNGNIKYVGDYRFNYPMNLSRLNFQGQLNNIAAVDFGQNWLQRSGRQAFSAPQTIASLSANSGIVLKEKLNGHTMSDFTMRTYWTNRDEFIGNALLRKARFNTDLLNTKINND